MSAKILAPLILSLFPASVLAQSPEPRPGWLEWRGPHQSGVSLELDLPEKWAPEGENHLWSVPLAGRGTPVISSGRVYVLGYEGEGATVQEVFACYKEDSGELLFKHYFPDFLSDTVYSRYSIASPTIDAETGNVYFMTTPGLFCCYSAEGALLWEHDLMAELGRLTFPNSRTGSVAIDGELLLLHTVTSHWGPMGPASDRFYAFEKFHGRMVWYSAPGSSPKDNPYSQPILSWQNGRRVFYAATGCGQVMCLDARTGDPLWRMPLASGGICTTVALHGDKVIAIHDVENLDNSEIGRMVAIKTGAEPKSGEAGPVVLDASSEAWRNTLGAFSSSPVVVGDMIYQTTSKGELCAIKADTGELLWQHKLAPDQIHASPAYGDGKLYVPMNNGSFFIVRPAETGPEILSETMLEGNCLGAPAIWNGKVFVHTTGRLYCFGKLHGRPMGRLASAPSPAAPGPVHRLQVVPADFMLRQGETVRLEVRSLDAHGNLLERSASNVEWNDAGLGLAIARDGTLHIPADGKLGTGLLTAKVGALQGSARVRIVGALPYRQDFNALPLTQDDPEAPGKKLGFPPAEWVGARLRWDVRELEGEKVLAKTLDNPLFQRSMAFTGDPRSSNYTVQVDLLTDGNRRTLSSAGVVNQRYLIQLKGNGQQIEVSSNEERLKVAQDFAWKAGVWYTMKTRVDCSEDGSAVVRVKVWPRAESEPAAWTFEVDDAHGHRQGAPGIFSFAPQSRFRVYLDNYTVTPNE